ncbi:MAG: hypothetical protein K0R15_622 [Clostridiales bacterium]|jgi:hypothetical protein|nr:hypothetical protein [Clostridiales bacterium]
MECEDGMVFSSYHSDDELPEEELLEDTSLVLNAFLVDSVIYVGFQDSEDLITISFNDGYIQIYY